MDTLPLKIRGPRMQDVPFIYDSWVESYRATLEPQGGAKQRYYRDQRRRIRMLFERGAQFLLAVNPDRPDQLLGFICHEGGLVHYIYVKKAFRRQGIAIQLLAEAGLGGASPLRATHWTYACDLIAIARPGALQYIGLDVPVILGGFYDSEEAACQGQSQGSAQPSA